MRIRLPKKHKISTAQQYTQECLYLKQPKLHLNMTIKQPRYRTSKTKNVTTICSHIKRVSHTSNQPGSVFYKGYYPIVIITKSPQVSILIQNEGKVQPRERNTLAKWHSKKTKAKEVRRHDQDQSKCGKH